MPKNDLSFLYASWKDCTLDDLVDVNSETLGASTPANFRFRYIDINSVTPGRVEWQSVPECEFRSAPSRARRIVRPGDTLFCTVRPGLEAHAYADWSERDGFICSTGFAVLRPRQVDRRFLFHTVFSDAVVDHVRRREVGSSYPAVNEGELKETRLRVPALEGEQALIGEILDTLDAAIRETEAVVAKLRYVKTGLLHNLLTRGLDEHGHLRDPARHPEQFQPTRFGKLPREWTEASFSSLVSNVTLGTTKRGTSAEGTNIPLLKMGNLNWGEWDLREVEPLKASAIADHPELLLAPDDFLFNTRNTPELVGKTAVWLGQLSQATHDNNLLRVRFKPGIDSRFVCLFMSQGIGRALLQNSVSATTSVAAIYWRNLADFWLPVAPPEEQKRIRRGFEAIEERLTEESMTVSKLHSLKRGLAHDLLTGRVRVKVGGGA